MRTASLALFVALLAAAPAMAAPPIAAGDPHVAVMGRTAPGPDGGLRFSYPGVSFYLNFEGTRLAASAEASGSDSYLDIIVDGVARKVRLAAGRAEVVLAQGLAPGRHSAQIVNRSETWQGNAALLWFDTDGAWRSPPALPARRLMILGDSVTCGAAIDRVPGAENGAASANPRASYGMLMAAQLDAQVHLVCYGGRGLVRTWEGKTDELNLADYYRMALPTQPAALPWDQRRYRPDAIIIAIGTNDFNPGIPERAQYVDAYVALLRTLLSDHPQARIMLTEGGILAGEKQAALRGYIAETVARIHDGRVSAIASTGYPGDQKNGHPTREQNVSIANDLLPQVRAVMQW